VREVLEEMLPVGRVQLGRVALRHRFVPAVFAGEIAGLRGLPDGEQRVVVEVEAVSTSTRRQVRIGHAFGLHAGSAPPR
jgi:hypothetical protein